ncbi:MAG: hypothetical protein PHP21_02505, partial [Patescibacteria group bacterium]|nr:hypothetical protein [Patescibacteria group bacterium]
FHRRMIWDNPGRGMMAGRIISDLGGGEFSLKDLDDKIWMMHGQISSTTPWVPFAEHEMIKIIGEPMDDFNFRVREVRPWPGCGSPDPAPCSMMFHP